MFSIKNIIAGIGVAALLSVVCQAAPKIGRPFGEVKGKDVITSKTVDLKDFEGKVVLIDFWATWCGPCRAEVPNLVAARKKFDKADFEIISISWDNSEKKLKDFVKDKKMEWHHILDADRSLTKRYDIQFIPNMFLIDHKGVLVETNLRGEGALEKAVAKAIEAAENDSSRKQPIKTPEATEAVAKKKLARADKEFKRKNYRRALQAYELIVRKYPGTAAAKTAESQINKINTDKDIQKTINAKKIASSCKRMLRVARSMVGAKRYDEARKKYQELIDKYPDTEFAKIAKEELAKLPGGKKTES